MNDEHGHKLFQKVQLQQLKDERDSRLRRNKSVPAWMGKEIQRLSHELDIVPTAEELLHADEHTAGYGGPPWHLMLAAIGGILAGVGFIGLRLFGWI